MKLQKLVILLISVMFLSSLSLFGQSFEGKIKYKMVSDGDEIFMDYFIKAGNFRFEIETEGQKMVSIIKPEKFQMLIPSQKMYMEFPMNMMDKMPGQSSDGDEADMDFDESMIENAESVVYMGRKCKKVTSNDDGKTFEIWLAEDMGNFMFMQNPMGGSQNPYMSKLSDAGFFPLKMIGKDEDGELEFEMSAQEIEEMSLEDSFFEVPPGYQKMGGMGMFNKK